MQTSKKVIDIIQNTSIDARKYIKRQILNVLDLENQSFTNNYSDIKQLIYFIEDSIEEFELFSVEKKLFSAMENIILTYLRSNPNLPLESESLRKELEALKQQYRPDISDDLKYLAKRIHQRFPHLVPYDNISTFLKHKTTKIQDIIDSVNNQAITNISRLSKEITQIIQTEKTANQNKENLERMICDIVHIFEKRYKSENQNVKSQLTLTTQKLKVFIMELRKGVYNVFLDKTILSQEELTNFLNERVPILNDVLKSLNQIESTKPIDPPVTLREEQNVDREQLIENFIRIFSSNIFLELDNINTHVLSTLNLTIDESTILEPAVEQLEYVHEHELKKIVTQININLQEYSKKRKLSESTSKNI